MLVGGGSTLDVVDCDWGEDVEVVVTVREDDVVDLVGGTMVVCVGMGGGIRGVDVGVDETGLTFSGQASGDPGETGICSVTALWPVESVTLAITFLPSTVPSATHCRELLVMPGKFSSTTFWLASII